MTRAISNICTTSPARDTHTPVIVMPAEASASSERSRMSSLKSRIAHKNNAQTRLNVAFGCLSLFLHSICSILDIGENKLNSPLLSPCPGMSSSLIAGRWCLLWCLSKEDKEFFLGRKEKGEQ